MAELSKLPQEMKVQMLSRLPPKSLMRFKCVHRSWHTLISSSSFAAKHVSVSKDNKLSSTATILFKRYVLDLNTDSTGIVLSLLDLDNNDINCVDDDDHLNPLMEDLRVPESMGLKRKDIWSGIQSIEIACHCNGIICLTDYRKRVVLCNPAIREFNCLPVSSLLLSSSEIKPPGASTAAAVGLGCELKNENYKVVRILHSGREFNDNNDIKIHPPRAEVYSLSTKCWKKIKAGSLDSGSVNVWPDSTVCIYCKGHLYWHGHEEQNEYIDVPLSYTDEDNNSEEATFVYEDKERIISFDIGSETFHVTSFPNGYYYCHKVFGLWNDSIAVGLSWYADYQCIHIWVLDNIGGVKGSWINCLSIEPVVIIEFPLAFVGTSGQSLLVAVDNCVVILYDYTTAKLKYLPVNGVSLWSTQALFYLNSVVSVEG